MITRHEQKSCCGHKVVYYQLDNPIRKDHVEVFKRAGGTLPDHYFKCGIFYVQIGKIVANGAYGTKKISVRCSGDDCEEQLNNFVKLLEEATA